MPTLLNIQSSPRGDNSISRNLSLVYVSSWQAKHPDGKVILRDLAEQPLPFVGLPWISGVFVPSEQHTPEMRHASALSGELIAELFSADEILIGTPMYNFTVPANLKAWIDLVVRPRVTHSGPPDRKGLVSGKICDVIIASGGNYEENMPPGGFRLRVRLLEAHSRVHRDHGCAHCSCWGHGSGKPWRD